MYLWSLGRFFYSNFEEKSFSSNFLGLEGREGFSRLLRVMLRVGEVIIPSDGRATVKFTGEN
jgi:hypothetical protein